MVDGTHLKVLLKKDFLTLFRNKGYLIGFILVPAFFMGTFISVKSLFDKGETEGPLIYDHFKFTSTQESIGPFKTFLEYGAASADNSTSYFSTLLSACGYKNRAKYHYSKVAIVADEEQLGPEAEEIGQAAKDYFDSYVLNINQTALGAMEELAMFVPQLQGLLGPDMQTESFSSMDKLRNILHTENDQPYCFAVELKKFDVHSYDFEFAFSFDKFDLPDTNLPAYNNLTNAPDIESWNKWFTSGSLTLYPYMTEFVARYHDAKKKGDTSIITQPSPYISQALGYSPLRSSKFINISPTGVQQLSQFFPLYVLFIFLVPYFYLVTKIAAEKESKAREGMKMMGLTDGTYYLSWFIIYTIISLLIGLVITGMTAVGVFTRCNIFLLFSFCVVYSWTFFGWAFLIVAFLPTPRSAGIAAILFAIISYNLVDIL